ncbi:FMN-dependent NADH-azoreductase [Puniceibacterium sediminis]|uniref:FMN dependent NADH:quinone oxidoreductase n=1 Tax=Puniceibacterium sediminis TaxID=1608407 RepID=A0A238Y459_9RHOB|nr:NAD(P)H-dependent oxidoreductase [Puniceibacterium sediminis]SNR65762.1 FMN-dependent NADH-azoreductase [Puniceibacterium sediminis]
MTNHVLRIDASARHDGSVSRDLTDKVLAKLSPAEVTTRDLSTPLPLIDSTWIGANFTPSDNRSDDQKSTLALSDTLIAEVMAADTLVIGLPIYNFGVPSGFKAWIDLVARAGVTFRYTENGPEGLLTGKRAILAVASGGTEVGSDYDFATSYARHVLGFIGITDVSVVAADRLMVDPEASKKAANDQIAALAA